jgi:uncharacterized membrane protein YfcA
MSYLFLMAVYAALVSVFFALLWRRDARGRAQLFLQMFLSMVVGCLALAWLMYFFPSGPPSPP